MDDQDLTKLLEQYRMKSDPQLPASFQRDVQREIRQRASEINTANPGWLNWCLEPLRYPLFAMASLAFAMLIGIAMGTYAIGGEHRIASQALDLHVFTSQSPALLSTSLHP